MSNALNQARQRLLGWMTLSGGVFVLLFWVLYFSRAVDLGQQDPLIDAFESAFPLADAVFAAVLFAAAYHLLRGKRRGPFFLVVAGSMSLYLGVLDATFYFGHGFFSPINLDAVIGLTVNGLCIGGGVIALRYGWRYWGALAAPRRLELAAYRRGDRRPANASGPWRSEPPGSERETEKILTEVAA